jgi:hypothetical protein
MMRAILILAGLLAALPAFAGHCGDRKTQSALITDFDIQQHGGIPAVASVSFCEDNEKVFETFVLGKSKKDQQVYLYVGETILPGSQQIWRKCKEKLGNCNEFSSIPPSGGCGGFSALFARPIRTGSGVHGKTAPGCKPVEYTFCGHGEKIRYNYEEH